MANRAAQIVSEWFVKCANVVLQSRIVLASDEGKQNRWVRRAVPRAPARPDLEPRAFLYQKPPEEEVVYID